MKKIVGILMVLMVMAGLITTVPVTAQGGNLLVNPGFETEAGERSLDGWGQNGCSISNVVAVSTGGARLNLKKGGSYIQQKVTVESGKTYEISFYYSAATDGRMEMVPAVYGNGEMITYPYVYFPSTGGSLEKVSYRITIPTGGDTLHFMMRASKFAGAGEGDEDLIIDNTDMRLVEGDENLGLENQLSGWSYTGNVQAVENAHDGNFAAKIPSGKKIKKIVMMTENTGVLSAYVKTTGTAVANAKVFPLWNRTALAEAVAVPISSSSWKKAEFDEVTYTPSATSIYPVMLEVSVTGEGEAYIDDVNLDTFTNLVTNGSFENGDAGWSKTSGQNPSGTSPALSSYIISEGTVAQYGGASTAYDGKKFVEITPANAGTKINNVSKGQYVLIQSKDAISVSPAKQYKLSFAVRSRGSRAQVVVRFYDGADKALGNYLNINMVDTGTNGTYEWRKHEVVFTPPANTASVKVQLYQNSALFSSTTERFIQYDTISLCEFDSYTGFYDKAAMTANTMAGIASWLGQEVNTLSGDKEFSFRFDDKNRTDDTAFAFVGLYGRNTAGKKQLMKVYAMSELARQGYTTEKGFDVGFKVDVNVLAEDLQDTSMTYTLEAFAWDSLGTLKTMSKKAIINN